MFCLQHLHTGESPAIPHKHGRPALPGPRLAVGPGPVPRAAPELYPFGVLSNPTKHDHGGETLNKSANSKNSRTRRTTVSTDDRRLRALSARQNVSSMQGATACFRAVLVCPVTNLGIDYRVVQFWYRLVNSFNSDFFQPNRAILSTELSPSPCPSQPRLLL